MSNFKFSLEERLKGDPAVFNREITKQLNDPNIPAQTTQSIRGGNEDFLSTLSVGQLLMGVPATNSQTDVYSMLDTALSGIVNAGQTAINAGKKVEGGIATAFDYLLPGDIAKDAINFAQNTVSDVLDPGSGSSGSIPGVSGGKLSSSITSDMFFAQCLKQNGKPYSTVSSQRFGPDFYDCSGYVFTALQAIGIRPANMPTVSDGFLQWCRDDTSHGGKTSAITPDQASRVKGALLIKSGVGSNGHIAVSTGDGKTNMAAHGHTTPSGVGQNGSEFDAGGLVPGLFYPGIDKSSENADVSSGPPGTGDHSQRHQSG